LDFGSGVVAVVIRVDLDRNTATGFEMVDFESNPTVDYYFEGKDFDSVAFEQHRMGLIGD
jgi:hypothetical protein